MWSIDLNTISFRNYAGLIIKVDDIHYVRWLQNGSDIWCDQVFQELSELLEEPLKRKKIYGANGSRYLWTIYNVDCRIDKLLTFFEDILLYALLFSAREEIRKLVVDELERR